jgi:spermidine synthase
MGATLPLLTRELTARDGALDQVTGWLYAINTFGAAAGCFLTGFQLLPAWGLLPTNNATAVLNLAIGAAALFFSRAAAVRSATSTPPRAMSAAEAQEERPISLAGLYLAVALTGLGALILEMTWSRQLALVLGGSTYAYSATLFVVLVGIATGSLLFHLRVRGVVADRMLPIFVIFGLAVTCFAGKLFLPWLSAYAGDHRDMRQSLMGNAGLCILVAAIVEFLPSVAMGILFPLFVDLTHERAAHVGRAVGNVYAWNTFGSIAGATLTAVVLFPRIGTAGAMGLAMASYLVALLLVLPLGTGRERMTAAGSALALSVIVFGISLPLDPLRTNLGLYMYGSQEGALDIIDCPYFVEGPSSSVAVVTYGNNVSLRVNGKVDAGDLSDMVTQLGLAYIPRIFQPEARDVLVIGFGSGTTSGTSLLFPDTHVTTCEIEPAVIGAEPFFERINHRPLAHTRGYLEQQNATLPPERHRSEEQIAAEALYRVVLGDGRGQLQGGTAEYDLIISEPSNPWLAGVSNLFTEEFFAAAKARLRPGGVLAQWIQTYNIALSDYLMIVRTMRTVFPHCGLITLTSGADTILLASDRPLVPDTAQLDSLQKLIDTSADISFDWQQWFNTSDVRTLLLARYTIDQEMLDQLVKQDNSQKVNTDLNLALEFNAPLHLFKELPDALSARVRLMRLPHAKWSARLGELIGAPPESGPYQVALALEQYDFENYEPAIKLLQEAIAKDPSLSQAYRALANVYLKMNKANDAVRVLEGWINEQPQRVDSRVALFNCYKSLGRSADAVAIFRPAVEIDPKNALFRTILGRELLALHRNSEAAEQLRTALALSPQLADAPQNRDWINSYARILATSPVDADRDGQEALRWAMQLSQGIDYDQWSLIDTLAAALAETGNFAEAVTQMQHVLRRAETDRNNTAADVARARLALYQAGKPLREQAEPAVFSPEPLKE